MSSEQPATQPTEQWWCERAWLGQQGIGRANSDADHGVLITVDGDRITAVDTGVACPPAATRLHGLTIPALANAHSHAFHRAMRGRTQSGRGSFWTWRDSMYEAAGGLDPDNYFRLAKAVYSEMALAGIGVVGEFHYVHHQPDGSPYGNLNAMAEAVVEAASEVGIRITLLDTLYLHGGLDESGYFPLRPEQERFSDRTADDWLARREAWHRPADPLVNLGAAIHSVRAVDPDSMAVARAWATDHEAPLHIHVSEQPGENEACRGRHGTTPLDLLRRHDLLGATTTIVHGTHLTEHDIAVLGAARSLCCFCPTTERDLADGIGPSSALLEAEVEICLGSDSHAVIDLFEEARALELNERLASLRRGNHPVSELLSMATEVGYRSLGWPSGGRLEVGALADFVTVDLGSVRTAGTPAGPEIVFSAGATDVVNVVIGGRTVVGPDHRPQIDWSSVLDLVA